MCIRDREESVRADDALRPQPSLSLPLSPTKAEGMVERGEERGGVAEGRPPHSALTGPARRLSQARGGVCWERCGRGEPRRCPTRCQRRRRRRAETK
eukprot:1395534-Rhodomonas_salina.1